MKNIKDPIYGYIDIGGDNLNIINDSGYQRLRRIRQLGKSSTVYPSANHTRFEHSLGVYHLTKKLTQSIDMSEKVARENIVAALLHDSGHLPFSHTFEDLFTSYTSLEHEDLSSEYIDSLQFLDDYVNRSRVKGIIQGNYQDTNLVSNEIDCDRLDYLVRDSHHTGINLGLIESDTPIKFAEILDGRLGFNYKALQSIEGVLDARKQMTWSVYSHDTVNITERMIQKAVQLEFDRTETSPLDITGLDDYEMDQLLLKSSDRTVRDLYQKVRDRELYKTVYYKRYENMQYPEKILSKFEKHNAEYESELADILNVNLGDVLISTNYRSEIPEFNTPIKMPSGELNTLEEVSTKPNSLRESMKVNQKVHIFADRDIVTDENIEKIEELRYVDQLSYFLL